MTKNNLTISNLAILLVAMLFWTSCASELEGEFFTFEQNIVVDGSLTDQNEIQEITLSYTTPVQGNGMTPLAGASVSIVSSTGDITTFAEDQAGIYKSTNPFRGVQNESYKLVFTTADGKRYESNEERMPANIGIERIVQRFAELPSSTTNTNEAGIQFFIDSEAPEEASLSYFRYEWSETHRVNVPYPSFFFWDRNNTGSVLPRPQGLGTCYNTQESTNIILGSTVGQVNNRVLELPTRFIPSNDINFTDRYSIEVSQHAISQEAHAYYTKLKRFNESNGSLFDTQQGVVFGNILSLDDVEEVVLGYFEVTAVSKKRVFYNINEFDPEVQPFITGFKQLCRVGDVEETTQNLTDFYDAGGDLIEQSRRAPFRPFDYNEQPPPNGTTFLRLNFCVNCTVYGELVRPAFWVD